MQDKPLIANVAGFSTQEFVTLVQLAQDAKADIVELNLSCPNVWQKDKQEEITCYHPTLVKSVLSAIAQIKPHIKMSVKISPLPPDTLRAVAKEIIESGIVQFVTATNSYPNAAMTSGVEANNKGALLAGLSGRALKPISLGVVQQLKTLLPSRIHIIAAGGISTATDVKDYLQAGAKVVQIASALMEGDVGVFEDILASQC